MRKSYKFAKKKKLFGIKYKVNMNIHAPILSIIDESGQMLGEMSNSEAQRLAQNRGFDLVEVNPNSQPPVAKLADYGGFKYKQEKIAREQKKKQKKIETKGIRISTKISEHDLETRKKQTTKFMDAGHKIKIELILKGREFQHIDKAKKMIQGFIEKLNYPHQVEQDISKQGNKLFMIIIPEKKEEKES